MKFTLANVFSGAFSIVRKAWGPLAIVTLLLYLVPNQLLMIGVRVGMGLNLASFNGWTGSNLAVVGIAWLFIYFLTFMHISAATEIAVLAAADKPVRLRDVFAHSFGNALPVFFIYLLCALGWIIGGLFLLVPAFIFGTIFSLVLPAYVAEKPGVFGAFSRSRALTKGHRWGIFGLWFLIVLIFYVLMAMVELPIIMPMLQKTMQAQQAGQVADPYMPSLPIMALLAVVSCVVWVILLAINASIYSCLRAEKDRFSGASVEKVFE